MSRIYIPKETQKLVVERAEYKCEYCFALDLLSSSKFNIEHIIPVSKEGTNDLENLALACHSCNQFKYNKLFGLNPETNLLAPIYHPRNDDWKTHFEWNSDYTMIIGLTPTGQATVATLRLNRFRLINQRVLYREVGLHPPKITI